MLDITLSEFYAGEYDESHDVGVYVVKSDAPLYVGMSTSNVWNRWFYGTFRSHLEIDTNGTWYGNTPIGRMVAHNMPASWQWHIELWRLDDFIATFGDYVSNMGFIPDRVDIRSAEQTLMKYYRPLLNRQA